MNSLKQLALKFTDLEFGPVQTEVLQLLSPDAIYGRAESLLELLREDRRIERKPSGFQARPLGEYLSMWSNTSPDGGLIVIGLADSGEVIGCAGSEQKHLNDLEKAGMDHCPDAKYVTRYVSTKRADGTPDCLLLFRVQYHPTK